jgi:hypothetical protein
MWITFIRSISLKLFKKLILFLTNQSFVKSFDNKMRMVQSEFYYIQKMSELLLNNRILII